MKKRLIFSFLVFIFTFFVINKVSKLFLENTKQENKRTEYIAQVFGKNNVKDYLKVSSEHSLQRIYEPYVEFKEQERLNDFTSVSRLGNRCNYNFVKLCKEPRGGSNEIWFFGGSTAFGQGLKNDETVTYYIEEISNNKFKAINFGAGGFSSTQSRILFQNLLTNFPPPYAAVFLNGNNDFLNTQKFNETQLSSRIRDNFNKSFKDNLKIYLKERISKLNFIRLINEKFLPKKSIKKIPKNNQEIIKISKILSINHDINLKIGKHFDTKIINILQPAPIYNNSYKTSNTPDVFKLKKTDVEYSNLKNGYDYILEKHNQNYFDLSNLKINKPMYIDTFHYTKEFNRAIAIEIVNKLGQ